MSLSHQRKITAALLTLYWPAFFVAAHTPVPEVVREAGVSDKGLHLLAYLILMFLLWFTVSDGGKVDWRRAAPWCVLLITIAYAIFDEWSQTFVAGRSCDARDFLADLVGMCVGLGAFSFLSFWPAGLLVTTVVIFVSANVARANLADLLPAANAILHLVAYTVFTAIWLRCIRLFMPAINPSRTRAKWLLTAFAAPTALLLTTKTFSTILGREWSAADVVLSMGATAAVVVAARLFTAPEKKIREADKVGSLL